MTLLRPEIMHIGFVSQDIEKTLMNWAKLTKAGPFLMDDFEPEGMYRGRPTMPKLRVAEGFSGHLQIQVVQPLDSSPSVYSEILERYGEHFHHIFQRTVEYEREVATYLEAGCELIFTAQMLNIMRVAFVDATAQLGCYVEIMDCSQNVRDMMAHTEHLHRTWDGKDPIRRNFHKALKMK